MLVGPVCARGFNADTCLHFCFIFLRISVFAKLSRARGPRDIHNSTASAQRDIRGATVSKRETKHRPACGCCGHPQKMVSVVWSGNQFGMNCPVILFGNLVLEQGRKAGAQGAKYIFNEREQILRESKRWKNWGMGTQNKIKQQTSAFGGFTSEGEAQVNLCVGPPWSVLTPSPGIIVPHYFCICYQNIDRLALRLICCNLTLFLPLCTQKPRDERTASHWGLVSIWRVSSTTARYKGKERAWKEKNYWKRTFVVKMHAMTKAGTQWGKRKSPLVTLQQIVFNCFFVLKQDCFGVKRQS